MSNKLPEQKPIETMSDFWDKTTWRDSYYETLLSMTPNQLTVAQTAEREYCEFERDAVARIVGRARRIADLGCGTGRATAHHVEQHTDKFFLGVDLSGLQLEKYRLRLSNEALSRISFVEAPIAHIPNSEPMVDAALFCNHTFGAIIGNERSDTLALLGRLMRTGGELLIAGFTNLALAPDCYTNWGMNLVSIDADTGLIELAKHYSLWEPAASVSDQLLQFGFALTEQTDFSLGYIQVYSRLNDG